MMNLQKVRDILSRYPLSLVDEILELKEGQMAVGVKQINKEDTFATGQNPNNPIMPGVLIIEAINHSRIRKAVFPGDELCMEVMVEKVKNSFAKAKGKATVAGELICEAEFLFAFQ